MLQVEDISATWKSAFQTIEPKVIMITHLQLVLKLDSGYIRASALEMTRGLSTLAALAKDLAQFPAPTSGDPQLPVILSSMDPVPSSGLNGHMYICGAHSIENKYT